MGNTADRYATLDGLRGVAALFVAVYHFQQRMEWDAIAGYLAVDLFFCLSGLVIARRYEPRLAAGLSPTRFLVDRVRRFYPLYAAGLAIGVAALLLAPAPSGEAAATLALPAALVLNAAMIPSPFTTAFYPVNGAAWSLFFELAVNLAFATLLWRMRTRALAAVAGLAFFTLWFTVEAPGCLNLGWGWGNGTGGAARALFAFALGAVLHRLLGHRPGAAHWLAPALPLLACAPILLVPQGEGRASYELAWIALGVPLIVALGAWREPPRYARAFLDRLGALSFPLYATHWPLAALLAPLLAELPAIEAGVMFVALALAVASAAERLVDAPAQAWLNARRRRRYPALTTTVPAAP